MTQSLTDRLCTRCGLCCDGSLFADVELAGEREATPLEIMGLDVETDGDGFVLLQPCAALRGTRCTVYAHRPRCCRTFECYLLQRARTGEVSVDEALARIRVAHARIGRLRALLGPAPRGADTLSLAERCAGVLAHPASGARAASRRARIERARVAVRRTIRETFLGTGG